MTPTELLAYCARKRAECKWFGLPEPRRICFTVPRIATGMRMRVAPGLMGDVLSVNEKRETTVCVDIDKVEAYARRVLAGRQP